MGKNKNQKKNKQGGVGGQEKKPAPVKKNPIEEHADKDDFGGGSTTASKPASVEENTVEETVNENNNSVGGSTAATQPAPVNENPVEQKANEDDSAGGTMTASKFAAIEQTPVEDKVDGLDFADGGMTADNETKAPSFGAWGDVSSPTPVTATLDGQASNAKSLKLSSTNEDGDSSGVPKNKTNSATINENKSALEGFATQSSSTKIQDPPIKKAGDDQGFDDVDWGFAPLSKKKRGEKDNAKNQEVKIEEEATRPASAWNSDGPEQNTPVALSLPLASEGPATSTAVDPFLELASLEPKPPAEPEPAPSQEHVKEDDLCGTIPMKKKKKKGRKGKDEAKIEQRLPSPAEPALLTINALPADDPIPTDKASTIDEGHIMNEASPIGESPFDKAAPIDEAPPTDGAPGTDVAPPTDEAPTDEAPPTDVASATVEILPVNGACSIHEAPSINEVPLINAEIPSNYVPSVKSVTLEGSLSDNLTESNIPVPTAIATATAQPTIPETSFEEVVAVRAAISPKPSSYVLPAALKKPVKSTTETVSEVLILPTAPVASNVLVPVDSAATSTDAEDSVRSGSAKRSEGTTIATLPVPVISSTSATSSFPAVNAFSGASKKPTTPVFSTVSPVASSSINAELPSKLGPSSKLGPFSKLTAPSQVGTPNKTVVAEASTTSTWPAKAKKPMASTMSAISTQAEVVIDPPTSKLSAAPSKPKEVATTGVDLMTHDPSDSKPNQMKKTDRKTMLHGSPGTTPTDGQMVDMMADNQRDDAPENNKVDGPTDVVVTKSNLDKTDFKPTEQQASSALPEPEPEPANADNSHVESTQEMVHLIPTIQPASTDDHIINTNVELNTVPPGNSSETPAEGAVAAVEPTPEAELSDLALLGTTATQSRKTPGEMTWGDFRDHFVEQLVLISKLPASARKEALLQRNANNLAETQDIMKKEQARAHQKQQAKKAAAREVERKAKLTSRPVLNHINIKDPVIRLSTSGGKHGVDVPKGLLLQGSGYFVEYFKKPNSRLYNYSHHNTATEVRFDKYPNAIADNIDVIAAFSQWLYTGRLDPKLTLRCTSISRMYIFAEKIVSRKFANVVMDKFIETHCSLKMFELDEAVVNVYARTKVGSPMRALLADMYAYHKSKDAGVIEALKHLSKEFVDDVLARMSKWRHSSAGDWRNHLLHGEPKYHRG